MADASVIFTTDLDESGLRAGLAKLKSSVGAFAKGAGIAIGAVATGLGALAKSALTYNSQMEQYYTSFTTLLGSEEKAASKVAELKEFAAKTPFEMTDLADATKTILSFGVAEDKASVAMKRLGDISQGNSERFSALSLVYGQMSSTGKLMGQDLLQMINAGFNPLTIIAEKTGASVADLKHVMAGEKTSDAFKKMIQSAQAEVKKLGADASDSAKMLAEIGSSGQISANLVDEAMRIATSEGGLFYQAMEKQSKTAAGLISTLKDNAKSLLGEVFTGTFESMKGQALPAALGYIDQLTAAFRSGGPTALMAALGDILGDVAGRASSFAPSLVKTSVGLIKAFLEGVKKNAKVIAKGLASTFREAVQGLIEIAPELVDVGLDLLLELADSLADALPGLLTSLVDSAFSIIVKLLSNVPKLLAAGAKIAQALVFGMMRALVTLLGDFWALLFGDANQKLDNALETVKVNIKPEVSDEDKQAMTDAINAGIEAADKVATIKAEVDTDIDEFTAALDAAFADDKFTKKELTNLQNTLNGQVDDAIDQATAHVEQKREEYKQTLLTLVDENGQPVYTEAAADTIADAMTAKTQELTAELDQARTDLNNLLSTIYASKTDPTQEQLDNINALLEQIGILEVKLGSLQEQAVQVAEAKKGRVMRGEGTAEDFGIAVGYTGEMYRQETAGIEADADQRLAALQAVAAATGATQDTIDAAYAQMDTVYGEKAQAQTAAAQAYNEDMAALYEGMAQANPQAAAAIQTLSDTMRKYAELQNIVPADLSAASGGLLQQIADYLATNTNLQNPPTAEELRAGGLDSYTQLYVGEAIDAMNAALPEEIEAAAKGLDDNPLILYLQTMLENGNFENLDITKVDGALKTALELVDFTARGEEAGGQLVDGVNGGIGYAAENLSDEDIIALREAMLEEMRNVFGIHSPATSMFPIGEYLVDGIVFAMNENAWKVEAIGAYMVTAVAIGISRNGNVLNGAVLSVISRAVSAAASAAYGNGFSLGAALGNGIAAGILSAMAAVMAAVSALVAAGASSGIRFAEVRSPSRLMRRVLGLPLGQGVGVGILDSIQTSIVPSVKTAITQAVQAGQGAMDGTLLSKVQSITGLSLPSASSLNGALLRGSLLGGAGSVVNNASNKTVKFEQNVTFESPMQAPDEIARAMRKMASYGLAGANG